SILQTSRKAIESIDTPTIIRSFIDKTKKSKPIVLVQYEPYDSAVPYTPTPTEPGVLVERVVAKYDYEATDVNELSFKANDVILVLQKTSEEGTGWWQGELN